MYKKIRLKKNQEKRIKNGHLWVFSNEIEKKPDGLMPGDIVRVNSLDGRFVGVGFYNPSSLIAVRMLSKHEDEINSRFFKKRISSALEYRKNILPGYSSFRLVYGESDLLPGLVIDKYENTLNVRIMAKGMMSCLDMIIEALDKLGIADNIYVSTDANTAKLENMDEINYWVKGANPGKITITEGGISFFVDLESGQKTGYFFDQRDNRFSIKDFVKDKKVLDCFCYTGSFSNFASFYGAKNVVGVDSSVNAIGIARGNTELNNLTNCEFMEEDVFSYIDGCIAKKNKFDVVCVDPPAFIKSKKSFHKGFKRYVALNAAAMRIVEKEGLLVSSSCSYHLDFTSFVKSLAGAAALAGRNIQIIKFGFQAQDHPVHPSMPETLYLKSAFCRIY
jgi:23S rRNA (cytosine1962-C5)-methyltransferase